MTILRMGAWIVFISVPLAFYLFPTSSEGSSTLYHETGLNGELLVADEVIQTTEGPLTRRFLLNNRIAQTNVNASSGNSLWDYSHYAASLAGRYPTGKNCLLLGLAGGNVANEMLALGFKVDAVELDSRTSDIAKKYFYLNQATQIIIDDARHYLNTTAKKYDVILADLFAGEGQPGHTLSLEAMKQYRRCLNKGGMLLVNFHGFIEGEEGRGGRSLYRTLSEAGFHAYTLTTPGSPAERNIIYIATAEPLPPVNEVTVRQNPCCAERIDNPYQYVQVLLPEFASDGEILTDDRPVLELLNREAARAWRNFAIQHYLLEMKKNGVPYF